MTDLHRLVIAIFVTLFKGFSEARLKELRPIVALFDWPPETGADDDEAFGGRSFSFGRPEGMYDDDETFDDDAPDVDMPAEVYTGHETLVELSTQEGPDGKLIITIDDHLEMTLPQIRRLDCELTVPPLEVGQVDITLEGAEREAYARASCYFYSTPGKDFERPANGWSESIASLLKEIRSDLPKR